MFSLKPTFDRALVRAAQAVPGPSANWLDEGSLPPRVHKLALSVRLPHASSITTCADALFSWQIHRSAGLRVTANGRAAAGSTVVLGYRLGPVWAISPCRVVDVVRTEEQTGFTYVALPGHPEEGAERFVLVRDEAGIRFEVSAASRHVFWGSRLAPVIADRVQAAITRRYLRAAASV